MTVVAAETPLLDCYSGSLESRADSNEVHYSICMCTYVCTCLSMYMCMCLCVRVCVCKHKCLHMYECVHVHVYTGVCSNDACVCISACVHAYMSLYVCICACPQISVNLYLCMCSCVLLCMCVCICVCICMCMCAPSHSSVVHYGTAAHGTTGRSWRPHTQQEHPGFVFLLVKILLFKYTLEHHKE